MTETVRPRPGRAGVVPPGAGVIGGRPEAAGTWAPAGQAGRTAALSQSPLSQSPWPRTDTRRPQPTPWPKAAPRAKPVPRAEPVPDRRYRRAEDNDRGVWRQALGDLAGRVGDLQGGARRPLADELFRAGTDPNTGKTRVDRYQLSIGCAGALLAELVLERRPHQTLGDRVQEPLLTTFRQEGTGRRVLAVHRLYADAPPRDPLAYQVLSRIVADAQDTGRGRPVVEMVEYLAEEAYLRVGERLADAGLMVEDERRRGWRGVRRRIWLPAGPGTDSLNALIRLPIRLRAREPISEFDRVFLGLADAVHLRPAMRREVGERFPWPEPDELRLQDDLRAVVDATRTVVATVTRR